MEAALFGRLLFLAVKMAMPLRQDFVVPNGASITVIQPCPWCNITNLKIDFAAAVMRASLRSW
jgi:hypothetical protein